MSTALTLYNSACTALSKARTLLDVKDVADKSAALKEYARLTKDRTLEIQAAELRIRSERELGKRLAATERNQGGYADNGTPPPTLKELELDGKISSRAQQLAKMADKAFETRMDAWRKKADRGAGRITTNLLRIDGEKKKRPFKPNPILWQQLSHLEFQPFFDEIRDAFLQKLNEEQKRWLYARLTHEFTAMRPANGIPRRNINADGARDINRDIGETG